MACITDSHVNELTLSNGKAITISGVQTLNGVNFYGFEYGGRTSFLKQDLFVPITVETRKALHANGVQLVSNRVWREVMAGVEEIDEFVRTPLTSQPGWVGHYFTEGNGRVHSPKGHAKARCTFRRSGRSAKGTFKRWKENVAVPLTGQHLPMIAVLAGLAGPCLSITGEAQNIGLEFWGAAGTGKTTCLRLMASVAGDPAEIPTFDATHAGLQSLFPAHQDLPFPVDEANLISRGDSRFLLEFAFQMASGKLRLTANQNDPSRYRFVFGTTSNQSFQDGLRNVDANISDAALQRLIPLKVPSENPLGVFDFLPAEFATSGALATHLNNAIGDNHGRPMTRLLKALVNERAQSAALLKDSFLERVRAFENAVGANATTQGQTRASSAFGLLYAVGEFAKSNKILPASWDCMAACIAGYRNYQAQLPSHSPYPMRLVTIAQRSQTLDLRSGPLPSLSDQDVENHGAFLHSGVGGRTELLFTEAILRQFFPDWTALRPVIEQDRSFIHEPRRRQAFRKIRQGKGRERLFCFVLPPSTVALLSVTAPSQKAIKRNR